MLYLNYISIKKRGIPKNNTKKLKAKNGKKIYQVNTSQKKTNTALLILEKNTVVKTKRQYQKQRYIT